MAPLSATTVTETLQLQQDTPNSSRKSQAPVRIVWRNVILFAVLHVAALHGLYLIFTAAMWKTTVFAYFLYLFSAVGITGGAHRLWAHRTYKAKLPLRIILAFLNTIAFQNHIYEWARDHRVHHKFSETDADPHNAKRGFFFSHIGWLLVRKHPEVIAKGKQVDVTDLLKDPVVQFQKRFYKPLVLLCCFALPTVVPPILWGESVWNAFYVCAAFRYCFLLHITWCVNSAAHMWGSRPYNKAINPRENIFVTLGAAGEGFHNYHHTFPWDYSASEFGWQLNFTTMFIDFMALVGWAYDRKTVPRRLIQERKARCEGITAAATTGTTATAAAAQNATS